MATLQIEEMDLSPVLKAAVKEAAEEKAEELFNQFAEQHRKQFEFPRYMNYKQAAKYFGACYNTLKNVLIPMGLRVIVIDGYERIDQKDADKFLETYKK